MLTAAYHALFGATASLAYCASIRTAVLAALALGGAWAGARWKRPELGHIAYPLVVLALYRLLMVDLRQDRKAALVLSLLVVGGTLTVLPRLRAGKIVG